MDRCETVERLKQGIHNRLTKRLSSLAGWASSLRREAVARLEP